jgi:hypothetical protein
MNNIDIDTTVYKLKDIDFEQHSSFCLLSSRKSGKSFMIRNLVYLLFKQKKIDTIYIFSKTAHLDSFYLSWVDKNYIFPLEMIQPMINFLFKIQESLLKKNQKLQNICIVLDDIDCSAKTDRELEQVYTLGRHYNMTVILSAQIGKQGVSNLIRNNCQYTFIRKLSAETIMSSVYESFMNSPFDKRHDLLMFVKENNEDYQFILYLNDDRPKNKSLMIIKGEEVNFKFEYNGKNIKKPEK